MPRVGTVEIQAFSNRKHPDGGKVVSPHIHAVVWGHDILTPAEKVAARYNKIWFAGQDGCDAIRVQIIAPTWIDMARVLRYPHKGADRMKNDYLNARTGARNINESEKPDRFVRFLRQYQILSMVEKETLLFASGAGVPIKNAALRRVHEILERHTKRRKRAEQMEWVTAFWRQFMPRVGMGRFDMPRIDV